MELPTTYEFIEKNSGRVLGRMTIKAQYAKPEGWDAIEDLDEILDGGLGGGLVFAFPCQGAEQMSHGHGILETLKSDAGRPMPYGSKDGGKIDIGCVIGNVSGYLNDNKIMTLTFDDDGAGDGGDDDLSHPNSVTTMLNNAEEDCLGEEQGGEGPEHGDKYIYFGDWVRKET